MTDMTDFEQLRQECAGCTRCPLGATRTNLVFGVGNEHADVMFIGEAPEKRKTFPESLLSDPPGICWMTC